MAATPETLMAPTAATTTLAARDIAHCPLCLTPGLSTDQACRGCGVGFEDGAMACASCFEMVEAAAPVCPRCGADLS